MSSWPLSDLGNSGRVPDLRPDQPGSWGAAQGIASPAAAKSKTAVKSAAASPPAAAAAAAAGAAAHLAAAAVVRAAVAQAAVARDVAAQAAEAAEAAGAAAAGAAADPAAVAPLGAAALSAASPSGVFPLVANIHRALSLPSIGPACTRRPGAGGGMPRGPLVAVRAAGTAEKQRDQNKRGAWEHQDPVTPSPPEGAALILFGARHARGAAPFGRVPPRAALRGLARVRATSVWRLARARVCACLHTLGRALTPAQNTSPRDAGRRRGLPRAAGPPRPRGALPQPRPSPGCALRTSGGLQPAR